MIFNITGDRKRKTKLQTLSKEFLSERIQESSKGHCSIEDSLACMKLTKHKLQNSLYYGDAVIGGIRDHIRRKQSEEMAGPPSYATSMLKQVTKMEKSAAVVGLDDAATKYNYYTFKDVEKQDKNPRLCCMSEKSNKAVIEKVCENVKRYSLNIGHVKVTDFQVEKEDEKTFKNIDRWVKQIYDSAGVPGLFLVIFGGKGDTGNGLCFIQLKK